MNSTSSLPSVSVIVPVFNEAKQIINNLDLLIDEIEDHFQNFEILVVSDGSNDGTNLELMSFKEQRVRVLLSSANMGKGHAIRRGFQEANGDYIFFIDGGMELHPKELKVFIGLMNLYEADIVVGSKRHPQSQVFYPWYRRILSRIYQKLVQSLFDINVTDTQVGLKLFKKDVIKSSLPYLQINRYGFDLELLSIAALLGYRSILEAPITMEYFSKNKKPFFVEITHVFKVGLSLLKETIQLYSRLRRIKTQIGLSLERKK